MSDIKAGGFLGGHYRRVVAQVAFLLLACLNGWLIYENQRLQKRMSSGMALAEMARAPDFSLSLLEGGELSLSDFRGRAGTLLFFDVDCSACDSDAGNWNALARSADSQNTFFAAICRGTRAEAAEFGKRHGLTIRVAIDEDGKVADLYNIPGTPFAYMIDKTGRVRFDRTGTEANCIRLGFSR